MRHEDSTGYVNTFIAVADDCPVTRGLVPTARGPKKTVAMLQYDLLAGNPHQLTQDDVLFTTWLKQRELADDDVGSDLDALRQNFFSVPKACLRASPLPKTHGWGLRFDDQGRVALCAMDSPAYQDAVMGRLPGITVVKAMRSRRA